MLTPNVVDLAESSNLGKEASKGLVVLAPMIDAPGPIIAPLNHSPRLEGVTPHLVYVASLPLLYRRPIAKGQHIFEGAIPQVFATLLQQCLIFLTNNYIVSQFATYILYTERKTIKNYRAEEL